MSYKFFDKRYMVLPDDKDIIGKRVFYADRIQDLIKDVESGDFGETGILEDIDIPKCGDIFIVRDTECNSLVGWGLAYYDPNYEAKVAYSQGKKIQFRAYNGEWTDVVGEPVWNECIAYRVKPDKYFVHYEADADCYCYDTDNTISILYEGTEDECIAWMMEHTQKTRRMTNKELARWLAEGNGEKCSVHAEYVTTYILYNAGDENKECDKDMKIREWDSNEWHEPLVEVK